MKYVIDASVAVTSVVSRPLTSKALRLRQEYRQGIHEFFAPSIFSAEVASALTKCERQKIISVGDALSLLDDILSELPQLHAYEPLLRRATRVTPKRLAFRRD
jgi:predicted nucleic acid-binding protein